MALDFNTKPYYDDFAEVDKFLRILFRPGYNVQARELTQLQTILDKQIERFGNYVFKNGSIVTGGEVNLNVNATYLKLNSGTLSEGELDDFKGKVVKGKSSGAKAKVLQVAEAEGSDPPTVVVSVLNGKVFTDGETIEDSKDNSTAADLVASDASGDSSVVSIGQGVYFVRGFFALVDKQTLILEKYNNTPTYRIGLFLEESIVDSNDDSSLLDPASGSNNYAAPGANRFKIDPELRKKPLDRDDSVENSSDPDFIELLRVEDGKIKEQTKFPNLSELEKTLARRTFDESGNYTVRHFPIQIKAHGSDDDKLRVGLEPGKAYVKGFEFENISTSFLDVDRARDFGSKNNTEVVASFGNYVIGDGDTIGSTADGSFDGSDVQGWFSVGSMVEVDLHNDTKDNVSQIDEGNYTSTKIGTARLRQIRWHSGTYGGSAKYRFYMFDIQMNSGEFFKDVQSIILASLGDSNDVDFLSHVDIDSSDGRDGGETQLFGSSDNSMIFPLGNSTIKTCRPNGNTDTDVVTQKEFDLNFSGSTASVSTGGNNTFFGNDGALSDDIKKEHYYVVDSSGNVIDFDDSAGRSITLSGSGTTATFDANAATPGNAKLIATVNENTKTERTKTLVENKEVEITSLDSDNEASLGYSDIYRLVSVEHDGDDVTDQFELDDGQRDSIYDHGSIKLVSGSLTVDSNTPLTVTFDYFTHSGNGYFSVDSYPVAYGDIPSFTSPSTGSYYELRNVLDFRPRRTDNDSQSIDVPSGDHIIPRANSQIALDYEYYLGRQDKIVLTKDRNFKVIRGIPALNPKIPSDSPEAMTLYILKYGPYTFDKDDVEIQFVNNRRYTMRDIGALEKRIDNLEYYTSLSLLEKETQNLLVTDQAGNNRFKNGILVEPFAGSSVADVQNSHYSASIDKEKREMRAPFNKNNVDLKHRDGDSTSVTKTGSLVTLPYTETEFVRQPLASKAISVNPFNITSFIGELKLDPANDVWVDTENRGSTTVNLRGENDGWASDNFSFTEWNDWESRTLGRTHLNTEVERNRDVEMFNPGHVDGGSGRRGVRITNERVERNTFLVDQQQSREGVRWEATPKEARESIGSRVVDVSVRQFIRARDVEFTAKGLKPNTQVYGFFDEEDVTEDISWDNGTGITDDAGEISGTLSIPAGTFNTGQKLFRLTDSSDNDLEAATTTAEAHYSAQGLVTETENVVVSTRVPEFSKTTVEQTRRQLGMQTETDVSSNERVAWVDPLAQTFLVDARVHREGVFLRNVELFFKNKPTDSNIPVRVEIRPVVNGYPHSSTVLPFSKVALKPDSVETSDDASKSTKFVFESPIFLEPGEYAIVVLSNDDEYETYIAEMGEEQIDSTRKISAQPYAGSLFKSQNASTWTAEQNQDLMFTLNRCKFETGGTHEAVFGNNALSSKVRADLINITSSMLNFKSSSLSWDFKATDNSGGASLDSDWTNVEVNTNTELDTQRKVEAKDAFKTRAVLQTDDDAVSPTIDMDFLSVIGVENLINNFTTDEDKATPTDPDGDEAIDDTSSGGPRARYITRRVTLSDGFDARDLKVYLAANRPIGTGIHVYVRTKRSDEETKFDDIGWTKLEIEKGEDSYSLNNEYVEYAYKTSGTSGLDKFKTFAVKVVLTSPNTQDVPRVRSLRTIAVDTSEA